MCHVSKYRGGCTGLSRRYKNCKLNPRRWPVCSVFTVFSGNATNRAQNATANRNCTICVTHGATHLSMRRIAISISSGAIWKVKLVCTLPLFSLLFFRRNPGKDDVRFDAAKNNREHGQWNSEQRSMTEEEECLKRSPFKYALIECAAFVYPLAKFTISRNSMGNFSGYYRHCDSINSLCIVGVNKAVVFRIALLSSNFEQTWIIISLNLTIIRTSNDGYE